MSANLLEQGKIQPQAPDLEQAVLGACMVERASLADVVDLLSPQAFYVDAHSEIWRAISHLHHNHCPVDILTVTQELMRRGTLDRVGGAFYVATLSSKVASSANVVYHAHLILQAFISREAIRIGSGLVDRAYDPGTDVFDLLAGAGSEIRLLNEHGIKEARTMAEVMADALDNTTPDRGVRFGFDSIDGKLRAEPGTVTIIGARPAMGKTSFMLSSAWRQAQEGRRPYVLEMEMKDRNLARRLVCGEVGIPIWKAKRRLLSQQDEERMAAWHVHNGEATGRMLIDEAASLKVSALAARLDRAKRKQGIDVVWVDYIGLLQPSERQKAGYDRMTAISNELRVLAKEIDLPMIVLAQLSRPLKGATVKPPVLTDLRDSGEIEQDAEAVMFLHRPRYYDTGADDSVECIIAKNRDGEDGLERLRFDAQGIRMVDDFGPQAAPLPIITAPVPIDRTEPMRDDVPF